jgi:hypothetical protein
MLFIYLLFVFHRFIAVHMSNFEKVKFLIENKADPNLPAGPKGRHPLFFPARIKSDEDPDEALVCFIFRYYTLHVSYFLTFMLLF